MTRQGRADYDKGKVPGMPHELDVEREYVRPAFEEENLRKLKLNEHQPHVNAEVLQTHRLCRRFHAREPAPLAHAGKILP